MLPANYCFVPGCNTGSRSERKLQREGNCVKKSLFKAPKDSLLLKKWQRAIPKKDKMICSNDSVCSLHFLEEDVLCHFVTKLADGTTHKIERERPKLRDGAVPCLFPGFPSYYSKVTRKRKPPCERTDVSAIKKRKTKGLASQIIEPVQNVTETLEYHEEEIDQQIEEKYLLFENLKRNLSTISIPNNLWSGSFIPGKNKGEKIIFAEWDDVIYSTKRRVVVNNDMSFKVRN